MRENRGSIILTLFGILFLASVDNQLLIPLLPLLRLEFSESMQALAWVFSVYALSAAVLNLVLGSLTDRFGRAPFIKIGLLLFALTALATSRVSSLSELLILRSIAGMSAGLLSTCTVSLVGDLFPYEQRGRIMGAVLSSYFAALILGIPLGSWLAENWGWRTVYWLSFLTAAVLFVLSFFLRRGETGSGHRNPSLLSSYAAFLSNRAAVSALGVSFLISGGTLAFLTFISGYLDSSFGLTTVQISLVFLVAGIAAAISSPISGWLSDRFSKRGVFLVSNTLLALPLILLHRLGFNIWLFLALFLISLCISFRQTALQTLQTELVSGEHRGAYLALRNAASQLGISISVAVAGQLYTSFSYAHVTGFAAILTLTATAILFFLIPEPRIGSRTH